MVLAFVVQELKIVLALNTIVVYDLQAVGLVCQVGIVDGLAGHEAQVKNETAFAIANSSLLN